MFPQNIPSPQFALARLFSIFFPFFFFSSVNNCRLVMNVVIKGTAVENGTNINRNFCWSRQTHLIA